MRHALEAGRAGTNGDLLWAELRIAEWVLDSPETPVLDYLHNDLALLLVPDLPTACAASAELPRVMGPQQATNEPATFLDFVIGLWAFSAELVRELEAVAAMTRRPSDWQPIESDSAPAKNLASLLR
jgi:hypothetical protein